MPGSGSATDQLFGRLDQFKERWPKKGWSWDYRVSCVASSFHVDMTQECHEALVRTLPDVYDYKTINKASPAVRQIAEQVGGVRSDQLIYSRRARVETPARHGPSKATEICTISVIEGEWDRNSPRCSAPRDDVALDWFGLAAHQLVFVENRVVSSVETLALDDRGAPKGAAVPVRGQEGHTGTWGFTSDGRIFLTTAGHGEHALPLAPATGAHLHVV